jgi:hypothetical protein
MRQIVMATIISLTFLLFVGMIKGQSARDVKAPQDALYKRCEDGLAECRGLPPRCEKRKSCDLLALINLDAENVVELTLSARMQKSEWIGLGVSHDDHMGNDTVYECWLDRDEAASIHMSSNVGHSNEQWTQANASAHIQGQGVQVQDGVTTCNIYIPQSRFNRTQFVALLAKGRLYDNGLGLKKRVHDIRTANPDEARLSKRMPSPVEVPKSTVSVSSASPHIQFFHPISSIIGLSIVLFILL